LSLPTFLHIPRTGGTVISNALGYDRRDDQHKPYWAYTKKNNSWTIVRNPFDRAVSLVAFFYKDHLEKENSILSPEMFKHFWTDFKTPYGYYPILYQDKYYIKQVFAPQVEFCGMTSRVFKYEFLEKYWASICEHCGVNGEYPERSNEHSSRRHKSYTKYYLDNDVFNIVKSIYQDDFLFFNYDSIKQH